MIKELLTSFKKGGLTVQSSDFFIKEIQYSTAKLLCSILKDMGDEINISYDDYILVRNLEGDLELCQRASISFKDASKLKELKEENKKLKEIISKIKEINLED